MYTFLACGEELHAPDSYSIELLLIVAQDSESQVQIQPQARYLYHIIWQFKIIIFQGASCHPRVQMGPSKVRGNLIKCWEVNCDGQE